MRSFRAFPQRSTNGTPMGGRGGEWGRCPTAPRSAAPSLGSPRPQVEVLFPIYGGGNGVCGAPPFCGSGGPFRVLWGLCPTSAPTPHVGGAGLGVPPPSGRGLRLAFLILRGQYWGRCWGLSPTSPPIPPTGSAGLGVPPPSALGSDPPLWGRSAPTPPFRDPISPFCISSVQRTNRALFSATAFLSVPASPHGVWGCSGAEGSGWDRA